MKLIICKQCGADELFEKNGLLICSYCNSKFAIEKDEKQINKSIKTIFDDNSNKSGAIIDLNDDIQRLLDKCEKEPKNANSYANLILDIDPTNKEALKYL